MFETYSKLEAKHTIQKHLNEFDVFVACGGDGTIQLTATELLGTDKILGVLPLGSGNDFSKILNHRKKIEVFISILKKGQPRLYDMVQVNGNNYFINTFGIGFDGEANANASKINLPIGKIKYIYAAIISLFNQSLLPLSIQYDNEPIKHYHTFMVVVTNGKWEGGSFLISPLSNPQDGYIELIISTSKNKWSLLKQILRLNFGLPLDPNEFKRLSVTTVNIKSKKPLISHSDGEVQKQEVNYHFQVLANAVNILTGVN